MAFLTLGGFALLVDRLRSSGLSDDTTVGWLSDAKREPGGAWTGGPSTATGATVYTTRSGTKFVFLLDCPVCKRDDPYCLCLVGFPSELQCPDCREAHDRGSRCECGPKDEE